jgi:predicted metal-dependent enzyme (double-stranded beta helix superfamily)
MMHQKITDFVTELRRIAGSQTEPSLIVRELRPLVQELVSNPSWVTPEMQICDDAQGFGVHLLHEEADHSLAVLVAAWKPQRGIPPHDHGTWSVVGGIHGVEHNTFWRRLDNGSQAGKAQLVVDKEVDIGPGNVICNFDRDIHSVKNESDKLTLSLHVYGKHINHTDRYGFDPETQSVKRLMITIGK